MGRKKKYETEEELLEARRKSRMDYYWKNRNKELQKSKERYHNNKSSDDTGDVSYEPFDSDYWLVTIS